MHSACLRFSAHSTVCLCEGLNICEELAIYLIGPNGFSHITLYERPTTRVSESISGMDAKAASSASALQAGWPPWSLAAAGLPMVDTCQGTDATLQQTFCLTWQGSNRRCNNILISIFFLLLTFSLFWLFSIFCCGSTVFEDQLVLLLILILQEGKPAPTAPCGFLQVRFLVLERRSQSSPFRNPIQLRQLQVGFWRWTCTWFGEEVRKWSFHCLPKA